MRRETIGDDEINEHLPEDNTALPTSEIALIFSNREAFRDAVATIVELSKQDRRPIPFRPLGRIEDHMGVVSDEIFPRLSDEFTRRGILFNSRPVQSISEMTREERRDLRKTGRRLG